MTDEERRERRAVSDRKRYSDPNYRVRRNAIDRERRAADPEVRRKEAAIRAARKNDPKYKTIRKACNAVFIASAIVKLATLVGLKCKRCGNSDTRVLQFHHTRPGDGKKDRTARKTGRSGNDSSCYRRMFEREVRSPGSIVRLCANCHLIEHWIAANAGVNLDD
jgi:hypothetical protein